MSKQTELDRMAMHYHWWPRDKARHMLRQLLDDLEEGPPAVVLTLRMGMKEDGTVNPWLCVEGGEYNPTTGGVDDSFLCPPFCR